MFAPVSGLQVSPSSVPFLRRKTVGVCLINIAAFSEGEEYLQCDRGKNSAAYYTRKASRAGSCGEVAVISRILGHGDHLGEGVMYLLVTSLVTYPIAQSSVMCLMHDTMLGASGGLALFKRRLGFEPYRLRWIAE